MTAPYDTGNEDAGRDAAAEQRDLRQKVHRARKRHECHLCGQHIEPGEIYYRLTWVDADGIHEATHHPADPRGFCLRTTRKQEVPG